MRMESSHDGSKSLIGFYLILLLITVTFALEMRIGRQNTSLQPLVRRRDVPLADFGASLTHTPAGAKRFLRFSFASRRGGRERRRP